MNSFPEVLILLIVRIIPLDIIAKFPDELLLHAAVLLYLLVGKLDGLEHIVLADLLHFTLNHHDVLLGSGDHKLYVAPLHILEARVDHELTVNAANADLGDWAFERKVGSCKCTGSGKACKSIRLGILVGRDECDIDKCLEMIVIRPERPDRTVDET